MSHSGSLFYRAIAGAAPANLSKAALFPFSHSPTSKVALFRPSDVDVQLSQSQTGEGKQKPWLAARGPYHDRPNTRLSWIPFSFARGLRRRLKGVLCDTARMARLMAALVFKLIPSSCRRLFFCVPLGATSLHARIFVCICSFATEGRLNGVTDKKFLF